MHRATAVVGLLHVTHVQYWWSGMCMFMRNTTGEQFKKKVTASWKSSNIIYLIQYKSCGHQYLGETGLSFHCRINSWHCTPTSTLHTRRLMSLLWWRFSAPKHTVWRRCMAVVVIEQVYSHDCTLRKLSEGRWIRTLRTSLPHGLNLRTDSHWLALTDQGCPHHV